MILWRRTHDRLLQELREQLHLEVRELERLNLRLQVELPLVRQARDRAEQDAQYWRRRAEMFIDQVGLRERIINTPTMTEEPPPAPSSMDTVFGALGVAEIHAQTPAETGAGHTAPLVTGVNMEDAKRAVAELLERSPAAIS